MADNGLQNQRRRGPGRPFEKGHSGNPAGRPKGSRNHATLMAEALLDGEAEALVKKAVGLAQEGNLTALRLCLERILPPRRDRVVQFVMPKIKGAEDAAKAFAALTAAVAEGTLTLSEAGDLSRLIDNQVRALEASDLERRLHLLEESRNGTRP